MKLSIIIPAYNEEENISAIIERTLNARDHIISNSEVEDIEIIVVSDGSTDNTAEFASAYSDKIKLIVSEVNRGYGAAIKMGWIESSGELLGFLDADGTCDPDFLANMCNVIITKRADIVVGARLNKNSQMPFVRKLGNRVFSKILSNISSRSIVDTSSGMRVIRRKVLNQIMPLPDGLDFTPAMSARALLSSDLIYEEIDMPYNERVGKSKLNLLTDGIRFTKSILELAFLYRPNLIFLYSGVLSLSIAVLLMIYPAYYYFSNRFLSENMIYRFIAFNLLVNLAILFLCSSYLAEKFVIGIMSRESGNRILGRLISKFFNSPLIWIAFTSLIITGTLLIHGSFIQTIYTGQSNEHWSRYIVTTMLYSVSFTLLITKVLDYSLSTIIDRKNYVTLDKTKWN